MGPGLVGLFRAFSDFFGLYRALLHFGPGPISGPPFTPKPRSSRFYCSAWSIEESRTISQAGLAVKQSNSQAGLAARQILWRLCWTSKGPKVRYAMLTCPRMEIVNWDVAIMYQSIPSLTIPQGDPRGFAHCSCHWDRVYAALSCPGGISNFHRIFLIAQLLWRHIYQWNSIFRNNVNLPIDLTHYSY